MHCKCLVLDYDDTVVNSTAAINWPSFERALAVLRPGVKWTLEDYFRYNFSPGFLPAVREMLHFTDEELELELQMWREDVNRAPVPQAFAGIRELLEQFRAAGGHICVVSHSHRADILHSFAANGLPEPELVFGWEQPPDCRKPAPWPLQEIMRTFALQPADLVVVDDLKPGFEMACSCGVDFLAAGWGYEIPEITEAWQALGVPLLRHVADLQAYLFDEGAAQR